MKKWRLPVAVALLSAIALICFRSSGAELLQDSDTVAILDGISARHAPLSWFSSDWPLANHFYRPIPTLLFEFDHAFYGGNANGFAWTNVLLCAFCVLSLAWLARELTDSPGFTCACTILFTLWSLDLGGYVSTPFAWLAAMSPLIGFWRHGLNIRRWIAAPFVLYFLATQIAGMFDLYGRTIGWLPGRTATTMTLFCLTAMASYARWERLGAARVPVPLTSTDKPLASRTSSAAAPSASWLLILVTATSALLAFASYEQAVMLPACLLAISVYFRLKNVRVRWSIPIGSWLLVPLYLILRKLCLPSDVSRYQNQQLRFGPGVLSDILKYLLPGYSEGKMAVSSIFFDPLNLLNTNVLVGLATAAGALTSLYQARRHWLIVLTGLALSLLAFLPMAWLKFFGHYHYWPMALRTIFVVALGHVAWDVVSSAACRPVQQAPARPSPAPGSLPRR